MRSNYFVSLKSKTCIAALFLKGRKIHSSLFMLRYLYRSEIKPPFRVVFAVSKKLGRAHERNRIKRRLREALPIAMEFHSWENKTKKTY